MRENDSNDNPLEGHQAKGAPERKSEWEEKDWEDDQSVDSHDHERACDSIVCDSIVTVDDSNGNDEHGGYDTEDQDGESRFEGVSDITRTIQSELIKPFIPNTSFFTRTLQ